MLKKLTFVDLTGTQVTDVGIEVLKQSLPLKVEFAVR